MSDKISAPWQEQCDTSTLTWLAKHRFDGNATADWIERKQRRDQWRNDSIQTFRTQQERAA